MQENRLNSKEYYDNYEHAGWYLSLMRETLSKMNLAPEIIKSIQEKDQLNFLVLGSATEKNLDEIALLDRFLRPGKGKQDTATIIDCDPYPLERHQDRKKFIEQWGKNHRRNYPDDKTDPLPYPHFNLIQGDMRELPLKDRATDVVISDYTLNFLSSIDDIDKSFKEISRVLSLDGTAFISIRGNDKYGYDIKRPLPEDKKQDNQLQELTGGITINKFPLHTYLSVAEKHGLELVNYELDSDDAWLLCGVLRKKNSDLK